MERDMLLCEIIFLLQGFSETDILVYLRALLQEIRTAQEEQLSSCHDINGL